MKPFPSLVDVPLDLGAPPEQWRIETLYQGGTRSKAVLKLLHDRLPPRVLKIDESDPAYSLREEAARQRWASERLPAPRVLGFQARGGLDYLLMELLPGVALNESRHGLSQREVVYAVAEALRLLHGLDVADCIFDERLDVKLARVAGSVRRGIIDQSSFDESNAGRTPGGVLDELLRTRPAYEDLAVTHGDAYIENFLTGPLGVLDLGALGVGDLYVDLAVAARSLKYEFGRDWTDELLSDYGIVDPDFERIRYYQLLDELF